MKKKFFFRTSLMAHWVKNLFEKYHIVNKLICPLISAAVGSWTCFFILFTYRFMKFLDNYWILILSSPRGFFKVREESLIFLLQIERPFASLTGFTCIGKSTMNASKISRFKVLRIGKKLSSFSNQGKKGGLKKRLC